MICSILLAVRNYVSSLPGAEDDTLQKAQYLTHTLGIWKFLFANPASGWFEFWKCEFVILYMKGFTSQIEVSKNRQRMHNKPFYNSVD